MTDYTNYLYCTWYYTYLAKQCSISVTRSIDLPSPASLSDVDFVAREWLGAYNAEDTATAPYAVALGLASMLPPTVGGVTGFRVLGFREGALAPVVAEATGAINGTLALTAQAMLPSYVAASYSAPTFTYRRKGPRFGWPVTSEEYVTQQALTTAYHNSFAGTTPTTGPGLLALLNTASYWDSLYTGYATRRTVVKRVPNTAPEGSGEGDRLPTFLVDPVDAVLAGQYTYSFTTSTRRGRRLKV